MCHAVIEVRYRNKTEPDMLIAVQDAEAMEKRVSDLEKNDMVERVRIFMLRQTNTRRITWEVTTHD